jgi:hypothetical protein
LVVGAAQLRTAFPACAIESYRNVISKAAAMIHLYLAVIYDPPFLKTKSPCRRGMGLGFPLHGNPTGLEGLPSEASWLCVPAFRLVCPCHGFMFFLFLHRFVYQNKKPMPRGMGLISFPSTATRLAWKDCPPRPRGFASQPFGWFALIMDFIFLWGSSESNLYAGNYFILKR